MENLGKLLSDPLFYRAIVRQNCLDSYYEFFQEFWSEVSSEELQLNWHLKYLCDELQKVGERLIRNEPKEYDLIINIPPGESKSTLCVQLFPAWLWARNPALRVLNGSYSGTLAMNHAVKTRDIIRSDKYQSLFRDVFQIKKDQDGKNYFVNNKGGDRLVTSPSGTVTGFHFHLILWDDPINPKQTTSTKVLQTANDWITKTLPSRKTNVDVTATIGIMQRLHEDDPTATALKKYSRVRHICLPASDDYPIARPNDVVIFNGKKGTVAQWYKANGGLLNPLRKNRQALADFLKQLGPTEYAGQFGQQPQPAEGNIFKDYHFNIVGRSELPTDFDYIDFVADTAYTKKTENDPSGVLVAGIKGANVYLLDWLCVREEFNELIDSIIAIVKQYGTASSRVFIEPKANGKSIVQYLKLHTRLNVIEYPMPGGDKVARSNANIPSLEAGRLHALRGVWNERFIGECTIFPNGAHDEAVDCLNMIMDIAINGYRPRRGRRRFRLLA